MTGKTRPANLTQQTTEVALMNKQRHILLVGSRAFANSAAALLESSDDVDTLHATHVTIDLFLSKWRPDCVIINCDDLECEPPREIEELNRFQSKVAIVLVSSGCVSPAAASAAAAILLPSEVQPKLAPLVASIFTEDSHLSAQIAESDAGRARHSNPDHDFHNDGLRGYRRCIVEIQPTGGGIK
jgi:hypothetical protein